MDDVVVEEEGLTDIYKNILSKDKIETILNNVFLERVIYVYYI